MCELGVTTFAVAWIRDRDEPAPGFHVVTEGGQQFTIVPGTSRSEFREVTGPIEACVDMG